MGIAAVVLVGLAGLASMRAAMERGDVDEASRQGMLAGPLVIEAALTAPDRPARLAGIAAAPSVESAAELLPALARAAASGDRRIAIPAARAAAAIARDVARRDRPDDIAPEDVAEWRAPFAALAHDAERRIEVRIAALAAAVALGEAPFFDAADPRLRRAAIELVPAPVPEAARAALAAIVRTDRDDDTAFAAAVALCADLAVDSPVLVRQALEKAGLDRIAALLATRPSREARRCLAP
jgi:hypothetical protein